MIQWIHDELLSWGAWAARQEDGGIGYPNSACFIQHFRPKYLTNRDAPFTRVQDDYWLIDRCVNGIEPATTRLVVVQLYKNGYRISKTAAAFGFNHKTIIYHRDRAHDKISRAMSEHQYA